MADDRQRRTDDPTTTKQWRKMITTGIALTHMFRHVGEVLVISLARKPSLLLLVIIVIIIVALVIIRLDCERATFAPRRPCASLAVTAASSAAPYGGAATVGAPTAERIIVAVVFALAAATRRHCTTAASWAGWARRARPCSDGPGSRGVRRRIAAQRDGTPVMRLQREPARDTPRDRGRGVLRVGCVDAAAVVARGGIVSGGERRCAGGR